MDSDKSVTNVRTGFFSRWGYFSLIASAILITPIAGLLIYRESQIVGLPDIGDPFDVVAFTSTTLPNAQNSAPNYRLAIRLMRKPRLPFGNQEPNLSMAKGWTEASDNVRQWVIDNQPALDALRLGSTKPGIEGLSNYINGLPDDVGELRELCRIATLDISRIATEQNPAKTWDATLALMRFGRHVGMRGTLIARLVGDALLQMGVASATRWIGGTLLEESLYRRALSDVVASGQLVATAEETLRFEYVVMSQLTKSELMNDVDFVSKVPLFLKHEPELSRRVLQHDAAIEFARLHSTSPAANVLTEADLDRFASSTDIGRTIRDSARHLESSVQVGTAAHRSFQLFLAAHIYRRVNGRFPSNISQVSEILKSAGAEAPIDPFSRSGDLLKFRVDGDRFVVWSIGHNEIDDSGREPDDRVFGHEEVLE